MQAGHDDRSEGRRIFCAMSHPELLELPAWSETLPAATGSRVALCPADGTPADGTPVAGVSNDSVPMADGTTDSVLIAGVPTGVAR